MNIVAFGDSLTHGLVVSPRRELSSHPYTIELTSLLSKHKYSNVSVIESGVSGEKTSSMLKRLVDVLSTYKPQVVLILGGTNDLRKSIYNR